jgi:hypothetical protein
VGGLFGALATLAKDKKDKENYAAVMLGFGFGAGKMEDPAVPPSSA